MTTEIDVVETIDTVMMIDQATIAGVEVVMMMMICMTMIIDVEDEMTGTREHHGEIHEIMMMIDKEMIMALLGVAVADNFIHLIFNVVRER